VTPSTDHPAASGVGRRVILALSFIGTQLIMLWVLLGPIISQGWWQGFRNYFANDQLSYAAIAITASKGSFLPVEPLTETGTSHYPSLWYLMIGGATFVTGVPVHVLWSLFGLTLTSLVLAFLGFIAYRFSHFAAAPLLPGLALLTGTLSMATNEWWFTNLTYHAVIWGPFGELFALNAGAIGLMLNVTVMTLVLMSAALPFSAKARSVLVITGAVILGVLANVQTYSFLAGTTLVAAFLAVFALLKYPSRLRTLLTIALVATVMIAGTWIAGVIGPLPLLVLLLAATSPAVLPLMREHVSLSLIAGGAFVLASAPQVVRTLLGIAGGDDFLSYRQASTFDLGVPIGPALLAALPILLIALFTALTLIAMRSHKSTVRMTFTALLIALALGSTIMAKNDVWGFNQEPYRFWLQYSIIAIFLLTITTAWSLSQWRILTKPWRQITAVSGAIAVLAWAVSLLDVQEFRSFAADAGVITVEGERADALRDLISPDAGLVLSSACTDPQVLKLITQAPVAFFNRGLAWPDNRVALDSFRTPDRTRDLTVEELQSARITDIVTDSACENEWLISDARVQPSAIVNYGSETFTRWQVQAAGS
jgi:hypothetical protein